MKKPTGLVAPGYNNSGYAVTGSVNCRCSESLWSEIEPGSVKPGRPTLLLYWRLDSRQMVTARIKPHQQQLEENARRVEQRRLFRRNQIFGLLIAAVLVILWTLVHTNRAWIFPTGWWRL